MGDTILGYLAILETEGEASGPEVDLLAAQHAATVYALSMARERAAHDVAQRLRDELVEGLLSGQPRDARAMHERALDLGYDPRLIYRAVVFALEVEEGRGYRADLTSSVAARRRLLDGVTGLVAVHAPGAILSARRDHVLLVLPEGAAPSLPSRGGATEMGHLAIAHARAFSTAWTFTVGVGGVCRAPTDLPRSYEQARLAAETARRFGRRGEVVAFEELGLYRLLHQVADPAELRGFVQQVLGALLAHDQKHNAELVRTLAAYLGHNGSLQATARDLTLHVNSVSYRVQRIQAITGLDLQRADDRLLALVALRIHEGIGER